ncbi:transglycosylase domain-containing protein [Acidocella sp. KAb 2-4]|uniref:transglycosylase domain-containing protein n=1 Tax=Acidocella sp. KAb 2-4 TaxID=2885158 RepID=UPI001D090621|nr:transglycosylase domain-containing protein [Acidocella sp. KAb 2-4]MCB5944436.1 transglycosylase domain-containing protein [Acidocella sp. KAb 2-4]
MPRAKPTPSKPTPKAKPPLALHLRRAWAVARLLIIGAIWGGLALFLADLWFTWDMPNPATAVTTPRRPAILLLDPAGQLAARFGDASGRVVLPSTLPPYVPAAFIAIEDRRFYQHGPFDLEGIARALASDLMHRRVVQGGSTLTQQVAKTLFLTNQRTLRRKVQEAVLSLWLARHYSRDEILGIYLNRVYLGEGAYGVDAAARLYFGVPARQLSLAQAAILAGLPKAPSSLNPLTNAQAAAARATEVLDAMVATGAISPEQENAAAAQLADAAQPVSRTSWFALWVMQQESAQIPEGEDITFATTLNPALQATAQAALDGAIATQGPALRVSQGAVVVVDAHSGAVRALIGGVGNREGYNRATLARRQTGSAIKPIVWLAGLRAGMSPSDTVLDAPLYLHGYHPHDYEAGYHGEVSMTEALADSMNTAAIRILLRAGGPRRVIAVARLLGLNDNFPDDATMALGTGAVGVLQMAAAYATFFNGGERVTPYGVTAINGAPAPHAPSVPVVDPAQAQAVAGMMRAVVTGGTGKAAFIPSLYTAGKTGTTQDYRDAWFIGYTGGDIIAVWLGNDDNSPTNKMLGGTLPAQIFKQVALALGG